MVFAYVDIFFAEMFLSCRSQLHLESLENSRHINTAVSGECGGVVE